MSNQTLVSSKKRLLADLPVVDKLEPMFVSKKTRSSPRCPGLAGWSAPASRLGLGVWGVMLAVSALANEALSQPGERLGTLFYSSDERSAITRGRQGEAATAVEASTLFNLSGIVKRERGNSTVWINGRAVTEGQSLAPTTRTTISITGVTLNGQQVRVGETVDINTHEKSDIVAPGAVTTKGQK